MNIAAFDLSLTAPGYATSEGRSGVIPVIGFSGMPRLRWIREHVLRIAEGADVVVIEGYSFGAKGNAILSLAELGGVIRIAFGDREQAYVDIPPACLKLFATGKGNAPKDQVLAAAIRKLEYAGHDHNEADALWLLQMATRHYVGDFREQTVAEGRALEKIKWPEIHACL